MTYDEFKTYIVQHLWKVGDSVLSDSLDLIIKTAEAELNRDLKVMDRTEVITFSVTNTMAKLPDNFQSPITLVSPLQGGYSFVHPQEFAMLRAQNRTRSDKFTVVNNYLRLAAGGTIINPLWLELWYYKKLTPYSSPYYNNAGAVNVIAEKYFDTYLYCCLKHTSPFLREDARLQLWAVLYDDALNSVIEEQKHEIENFGAPLQMVFDKGIR